MTKEELNQKQTEEIQGGSWSPELSKVNEKVQGGAEALLQTEDFQGGPEIDLLY